MCRLDGGRWRDCEEHSLFPLPDGPHNLSVLAVDPTGRSDATPVHHIWEVSPASAGIEKKKAFSILPVWCAGGVRGCACAVDA